MESQENDNMSGSVSTDMENFTPQGLRVLVVENDKVCLSMLDKMLQECEYNVTTSSTVSQALSLVMEGKERFQIILCDMYLPGEDGLRLLDIVHAGFELPVIMMSNNGETSAVMTAIMRGASDFLIKPLRIEELKNIWQHVVRQRQQRQESLSHERSQSRSTDDGYKAADSTESICSLRMMGYKRKNPIHSHHHHSSTAPLIEDISGLKKARVHWTVQLHHQFVKSVNQLGLDKAVPKRILEIMNVQGLTRENVASHLQKYRLHLKRLSGKVPEPCPVASFQAAADGKSGGKLQIRPRHRKPTPYGHSSKTSKEKHHEKNQVLPSFDDTTSLNLVRTHEQKISSACSDKTGPETPPQRQQPLSRKSSAASTTNNPSSITSAAHQEYAKMKSGNSGAAISFVDDEEMELLDNLAEECGLPVPSDDDFKISSADKSVMVSDGGADELSLADYFLNDFLHHHHQNRHG